MRQPELFLPARALAPATPTQPNVAPARAGGGASFTGLMRDVQGEVGEFIAHGAPAAPAAAPGLSPEGLALRAGLTAPGPTADTQKEFIDAIAPWARAAGERLGVAPHLIAAHAALESGWGQRPLRGPDGAATYNLFGIKAGARWQGQAAAVATTEYEHGAAVNTTAAFRSYADQGAAFQDYAQMLLQNPRYRAALHTGSDAAALAQGLARGGYATDPAYAAKLTRVAALLRHLED